MDEEMQLILHEKLSAFQVIYFTVKLLQCKNEVNNFYSSIRNVFNFYYYLLY